MDSLNILFSVFLVFFLCQKCFYAYIYTGGSGLKVPKLNQDSDGAEIAQEESIGSGMLYPDDEDVKPVVYGSGSSPNDFGNSNEDAYNRFNPVSPEHISPVNYSAFTPSHHSPTTRFPPNFLSSTIHFYTVKKDDRTTSLPPPSYHPPQSELTPTFFSKPEMLAIIIGCACLSLLITIIMILWCVYRLKKKDEGDYALHQNKRGFGMYPNPYAPPGYQGVPTNTSKKEFYA